MRVANYLPGDKSFIGWQTEYIWNNVYVPMLEKENRGAKRRPHTWETIPILTLPWHCVMWLTYLHIYLYLILPSSPFFLPTVFQEVRQASGMARSRPWRQIVISSLCFLCPLIPPLCVLVPSLGFLHLMSKWTYRKQCAASGCSSNGKKVLPELQS